MLHNGRGIVLSTLKYGDTSVIAKILTQDHGLLSFLIQGVYRKKARISSSQLQPFSILEMVYYHKEHRQLHKVKEVRATPPLNSLQSDVIKTSVSLFCVEVLINVLRTSERDDSLYGALERFILEYEMAQKTNPWIAHLFLIDLAELSGFAPSTDRKGRFFYLNEGVFSDIPGSGSHSLNAQQSMALYELVTNRTCESNDKQLRSELLDDLIRYFEFHSPGFKPIKSLSVVRTVLQS